MKVYLLNNHSLYLREDKIAACFIIIDGLAKFFIIKFLISNLNKTLEINIIFIKITKSISIIF